MQRKAAYEAFNNGDLNTLKDGFAEDAEWADLR